MSENYPSAVAVKEEVPAPPKSNMRTYITAALIIALLATWGYIIWDKSNNKEIIQQKDNLILNTSNQRDLLQKELEQATIRYDLLKTNNAQKDSTITAKDKEIAEKQAYIKSVLSNKNATDKELAQARAMITGLNSDIDGYKQQVETLQAEKAQLTQEKLAVTEQRDKVQKDFDSAKTVIKQREDVIDIGSTLHASNFNIVPLDEKRGKVKETTKAKKVDKLRISFNLDENRIANSGQKSLYISITGPDGKPIAVESQGSGIFTTRDGEDKTFTQRIDVNYIQGQRQTVSFDWSQGKEFQTGDYKIEVYNNGFKIGEGVRGLKSGGLF